MNPNWEKIWQQLKWQAKEIRLKEYMRKYYTILSTRI